MKKHRTTSVPHHGSKGQTSYSLILFSHVPRTFFQAGELYLFHRSDIRCPSSDSMWGQYDKRSQGRLFLESSSKDDLRTFRKWHVLPSDYRYCRRANRNELRNYVYALSWSEVRRFQ